MNYVLHLGGKTLPQTAYVSQFYMISLGKKSSKRFEIVFKWNKHVNWRDENKYFLELLKSGIYLKTS